MKKKTIALFLALALVVGCAIGGTVAWLTATSDTVTNTFTTSDISVTLAETTGTSYKMVPGNTIAKDPKATVTSTSEDCYLFVKIEKSDNFDTFMTYTVADGWTMLTGVTGVDNVYYRVFDSKDTTNTNAKGTAYSVLKDDQVTVNSAVTKTQMNALTANTYPTLTFTAYASQLYKDGTNKFTAAEAWNNVKPTT